MKICIYGFNKLRYSNKKLYTFYKGMGVMKIELIKPSVQMETMIVDFVSEFKEHKEDTINGCCGLTRFNDYSEWIQYINKVENGLIPDRISSSTFVAVDKLSNAVVGIIDIKHSLSKEYYYSGHIGYSIRPSLRGKGYGTEILRLSILKAKELNIEKLLLTCKKSNIASQKVIKGNNGLMEKEILEDGKIFLVYWIHI